MTALGPVGFLGLGPMGLPMARHLANAGAELTVWNRTPERAAPLLRQGGRVQLADTPLEAARPVVITMLPDLPHVIEQVERPDGLRAGWAAAGVDEPLLVVMGTVSPVAVARWGSELATDGIRLIDAPVSGGVRGAEERRLSIMVGGADADVTRLTPLFATMGSTVLHLGPVGSGELAKACNQIVVAGTLNAIAEAIVLARAGGLDVATVLDILDGGLASSEVLRQKRDNWLTDDYEGGGSSTNQLKDLLFCLDAGERYGVTLALTEVARRRYAQLVEEGEGHMDHSAVLRTLSDR